jgi:CheY-like chemotaxis protein/glycine cleavage system H lipoate-binding protein
MNAKQGASGERLTILIVDDEQIVLDSARKLLRKEPLRLETALSAGEGLERLEQGDVQVVLTDLMMPGMDGLEFTRRIKERWPAVPVVMVTGYATISTAMQAMKLGAFDYIAKPFTKAELRGIVQRALHLVAEVARDRSGAGLAAGGQGEGGSGQVAEDAAGVGGVAGETGVAGAGPGDAAAASRPGLRTLGRNSWMMMQRDGSVLIGVEASFVKGAGVIRDIDLPSVGDVLTQGAVCLQIFSADLQCHTVWSPLSGEVIEVNQMLIKDAATALQDPYGEGWLLRVQPSNFEDERKVLGL